MADPVHARTPACTCTPSQAAEDAAHLAKMTAQGHNRSKPRSKFNVIDGAADAGGAASTGDGDSVDGRRSTSSHGGVDATSPVEEAVTGLDEEVEDDREEEEAGGGGERRSKPSSAPSAAPSAVAASREARRPRSSRRLVAPLGGVLAGPTPFDDDHGGGAPADGTAPPVGSEAPPPLHHGHRSKSSRKLPREPPGGEWGE